MTDQTIGDIRYVIFHKPGQRWQADLEFRDQPGVMEHVQHYRKLQEEGKLMLGGPFLETLQGGMMIPAPGVSMEEIVEFAAMDPAVRGGLLVFEVHPWYVAMKRDE
jgi:uncharacterized protein YciI